MSYQKKIISWALVVGCMSAFASPSFGHSLFKKRLEAKYPNMKVTCNVCHIAKESKKKRNPYGELFTKTFKSKTLTADWKSKKGADKKDFEKKVMTPEFDKAFEKIKAMTFHDLIEAGVVSGMTPKSGSATKSSATKKAGS